MRTPLLAAAPAFAPVTATAVRGGGGPLVDAGAPGTFFFAGLTSTPLPAPQRSIMGCVTVANKSHIGSRQADPIYSD